MNENNSSLKEIITPSNREVIIRGKGLLFGIDFIKLDPSGNLAKKAVDECFKNRVIVERAGRENAVLKIMPPLNIDQKTMLAGLEVVKEAVKAVIK